MEKYKLSWESPPNQDFICYFNDNDELIMYDNFNKKTIKVDGNVEIKLKHRITQKWIDWTTIIFKIGNEKYPLLFAIDDAIVFDSHLEKIVRFYKIFNYTITNEIELSGKSLSKIYSLDNLNTETFFYLYNKNPVYEIEFNIDFKFYEDINKSAIKGFRITYPDVINRDFRLVSRDIEENLHKCLNGQKARLLQINRDMVKNNLENIQGNNIPTPAEIINIKAAKEKNVNGKPVKKSTTIIGHQRKLDMVFDLVEKAWRNETNRTEKSLHKIYTTAKGKYAKNEGKDRSQLNTELNSVGGFDEIKAKINKIYRENI